MRHLRKTATAAILLAAGALLALSCPGTAQAATPASCHRVHQQSGNGYGILNNNQIYLPVDLGLNITDNALGILGAASAAGSTHNTTIDCGN